MSPGKWQTMTIWDT